MISAKPNQNTNKMTTLKKGSGFEICLKTTTLE